MTYLTLTHPERPDFNLPQPQSDDNQRQAITDIAAPLGSEEPPNVHTRGRQAERQINGLYLSDRGGDQSRRQDVADFIDNLEQRTDQFQGEGYTLLDEQLDTSRGVILNSSTWQIQPGRPYEVRYELGVQVGIGTAEVQSVGLRNPTVNDSMDTYLEIDGIPLPGMRQYESTTEVPTEVNPRFNRDTAETNDIIIENKETQRIIYRGTHTGPQVDRAAADRALRDLLATKIEVECKTKVPGYTLDGFVTSYNSDFNGDFGETKHNYELEFTVGVKRGE